MPRWSRPPPPNGLSPRVRHPHPPRNEWVSDVNFRAPRVGAEPAPDRGGTLRIARPPASEAETLDPASALSAYEYLGALYNRLVRVDANGDLAPDLAESWEPDAQARTWTFRIREGATFHDGRRLNAADAAYTLRHILDKATASPQAAVLASLIDPKTLRTPDEHTLVVPLKTPNAEFPSLLTHDNC
ncbi:ABC transporter substrate-binding protein [Streptomyces mirabilis]|uniref:ABC transporter substrate-binding protein n=1 Tax=Streptomyces mirabilis TaxID=68239 RepID=UPI0036653B9F